MRATLSRHLATSLVSSTEHGALAAVDTLIAQCRAEAQSATDAAEVAPLFDDHAMERANDDEAAQRELEDDLTGAVGGMRAFADSFAAHLREDARRVDRLSALQRAGAESMGGNMRGLLDFERLAAGLGLMRLLYMSLLAIGLTLITLIFVYVDAMIF